MKLLVIDCDYLMNKAGEPVIRIFGKKYDCHDEEKDVVLHARGFEPYCYANIGWNSKEIVESAIKEYIKRLECVERFQPIGYQVKPSEMLKIVLHNPKHTPEVRKILENLSIQVMEADVLFKNRYLLDNGISGMSVVEFDEIGKELKNYGLNCDTLYITNYKDIRPTADVVNIEY